MLTVKDFNILTLNLTNDYIIQMSNHSKEYTIEHPNVCNNGRLYYDGYGLDFCIDWNINSTFTLGEFRSLLDEHNFNESDEIISMDGDDGSYISFNEFLIINEKIILIIE